MAGDATGMEEQGLLLDTGSAAHDASLPGPQNRSPSHTFELGHDHQRQ